jgi:hypothetical protein
VLCGLWHVQVFFLSFSHVPSARVSIYLLPYGICVMCGMCAFCGCCPKLSDDMYGKYDE